MERTDDRICPEARPYLVVATDDMLTRWGHECGRIKSGTSVAAWACYSQAQRQRVAGWIRERPEMKRVRMVDTHDRAYYPRNCAHLHIYATEPDEGTPEYRVKHLCELAVRNEKDLYNQGMSAFRGSHSARLMTLANAVARRVRLPTWSGDDRAVTEMPLAVATRIALEVAHEYRAARLSDDPSEDFSEAI